MKEHEALEDLPTPGFEHLGLDGLEALEVGLQGPAGHQLRYKDNVLLGGNLGQPSGLDPWPVIFLFHLFIYTPYLR